MVVDWLQTSPGGTGVFRCSMAQAISHPCTGRPLIPGCSSKSGWAKGDMRTASQRAVPGPAVAQTEQIETVESTCLCTCRCVCV